MSTYDTKKIENWYENFNSYKKNFINSNYNSYKNGYICKCNDELTKKMERKLNPSYEKAKKAYETISEFWGNFYNDLVNMDNYIAGMGGLGSINSPLVAAKLKNLPNLEQYKTTFKYNINNNGVDAKFSYNVKPLSLTVDNEQMERAIENNTHADIDSGAVFTEVASTVKDTVKLKFEQMTGAIFTEDIVNSKLKEWFKNLGIDALNLLKKACATIGTFVVSLIEGIGKILEGIGDASFVLGAILGTAITGVNDIVRRSLTLSTGEVYNNNATLRLWELVRSIVSEDIVESTFNNVYLDSKLGNWLKSNAIGFDITRQIGAGVGEVVGAVALSALTIGVVPPSVFYGVGTAGENTATNWQDEDTSTIRGLAKGSVQGLIDGAFFALGLKGDKIAKASAKSITSKALEKGGKEALKAASLKTNGLLLGKMGFEGASSALQDLANIGVDILFSSNDAKDEYGRIIQFKSFEEKAKYYYDKAGGTNGLISSLGTASFLSLLADYADTKGIYELMIHDNDLVTKETIKSAKEAVINFKNESKDVFRNPYDYSKPIKDNKLNILKDNVSNKINSVKDNVNSKKLVKQNEKVDTSKLNGALNSLKTKANDTKLKVSDKMNNIKKNENSSVKDSTNIKGVLKVSKLNKLKSSLLEQLDIFKKNGFDDDSIKYIKDNNDASLMEAKEFVKDVTYLEKKLGFTNSYFKNGKPNENNTGFFDQQSDTFKEYDNLMFEDFRNKYQYKNLPSGIVNNPDKINEVSSILKELDKIDKELAGISSKNKEFINNKDRFKASIKDVLNSKNSNNNVSSLQKNYNIDAIKKGTAALVSTLGAYTLITNTDVLKLKENNINGKVSENNDVKKPVNTIPINEINKIPDPKGINQDNSKSPYKKWNFGSDKKDITNTPIKENTKPIVKDNITDDIKLGGKVNDFNVSKGYISSYDASRKNKLVNLNNNVVNKDSIFKRVAVFDEKGNMIALINEPNTSVSEICEKYNVKPSQIAVDVANSKGQSQAWVLAEDLIK